MSTNNVRTKSSRDILDAELDEIRRKNLTKTWLEQNKIDPGSARNVIPLAEWQNKKRTNDEDLKKKVKSANQIMHSHHYKPKIQPRQEAIKEDKQNNSSKSYNAMEEPTHFVDNTPSFSDPIMDHQSDLPSDHGVIVDIQQTIDQTVSTEQPVDKNILDLGLESGDSNDLNDITMKEKIETNETVNTEQDAPAIIPQFDSPFDTPFDSIETQNGSSHNLNAVPKAHDVAENLVINEINQTSMETQEFPTEQKFDTSFDSIETQEEIINAQVENETFSKHDEVSENLDFNLMSMEKQESVVQKDMPMEMAEDQLSLHIAEPEQANAENQNSSEVSQEQIAEPQSSIIDLSFSFRFFTKRQVSCDETSALNPLIQNALSVINTAIHSYDGNVLLQCHPFCSDVQIDSSYAPSNSNHKFCYIIFVSMSLEILPEIDVSQVKDHVLNSLRVSVANGSFRNGSREL